VQWHRLVWWFQTAAVTFWACFDPFNEQVIPMSNPYLAPNAALSDVYGHDEPYTPAIFAVQGRIGRLRYLAYSIGAMFLVAIVGGIIAAIIGFALKSSDSGVMGGAALTAIGLFVYLPIFALSFIFAKRRLNDLNRTGWLSLLTLIPLVNFLLAIYLIFFPGTDGSNDYGPMPIKNSTGVVIGAFGFLIIPVVIGILAAIALPAYQDYVTRAKNASSAQPQQDLQELQQQLQQQMEQQQSRP
jgi:uncharacterized membrane protein YhaH (DUF805 family)